MPVIDPKYEHADSQHRHSRDAFACSNLKAMSLSTREWSIRAGDRATLSTLDVGNESASPHIPDSDVKVIARSTYKEFPVR